MSIAQHGFRLPDPLLHGMELPHRGRFHPDGFPVEVASNSPLVLQAAEVSWGAFPARFSGRPLAVNVAVAESAAAAPKDAPVFRAQRHLIAIVADAGNFGVCDYRQRFAFLWTTAATVADSDYFRYYLLDAAVYTLLSECEMTPVHAACVASGGAGVLLCGLSGAGKTTLAHACATRGWTYICDDTVMLPWESPAGTVLGNPLHMRFRTNAPQVPPELAARFAASRRHGKPSVEIPAAEIPGIRTAFECAVTHVAILDRRESGPAELIPISAEQALASLARDVPLYEAPVVERHLAALRALVGAQTLQLRYSHAEDAVEVLDCLAEKRKPASSSS